ncbi:hypothetical protein PSPO01_11422 [Paraphaeosphaeria sporulosa]
MGKHRAHGSGGVSAIGAPCTAAHCDRGREGTGSEERERCERGDGKPLHTQLLRRRGRRKQPQGSRARSAWACCSSGGEGREGASQGGEGQRPRPITGALACLFGGVWPGGSAIAGDACGPLEPGWRGGARWQGPWE